MKETIIFGGGFNPPTSAHQQVVETCLEQYPNKELWIMPSADRHDKQFQVDHDNRLDMLEHMISEIPQAVGRVSISRLELDELEAPTKTHVTVEALGKKYPDHAFQYVFGRDAYESMPNWENGDYLQNNLPMIIIPRGDMTTIRFGSNCRLLALGNVRTDLSSTLIRNRVEQGEPIRGLVCAGVARYIEDRMLYKM